jgi:hypothetical protein
MGLEITKGNAPMRRLILILAVMATALAGCASDRRSDSMTETLNRYGSVVRWGDARSAMSFVDPKVLEANPPSSMELSRWAQVRVSGYDEGVGPLPGDNPNEVRQVVQINLINNNTQAERSVVDHQVWRYDPEKHKWWLMSGIPNISPPQ